MSDGSTIAGQLNAALERAGAAENLADERLVELEALRKLAEALLPRGNILSKRARAKLDHWFYTHGGGVL